MSSSNPDSGPTTAEFEPQLFAEELKRRSVRGGMTLVLAQASGHLIRLVMLLLLARLLTPADFGLVAMVASVLGLAHVFLDMGLSLVTAQRPNLTASQASTLFWLNTTFGAFVALLCAAMAPLIATFYAEPHVRPIALALAFGFFINGLSTQHNALLRRMLQFAHMARLNLLTVASAALVAVVVALYDGGYWALVAYALTEDVMRGLLAWRYCDWRPGRPQFDRDTLEMVSHGGYIVGFGLMGYLGRNLHNILIGHFFGSRAVGLYGRANGLVNTMQSYASSAIDAVVLPALSQLRSDARQYRDYYLKALRTAMLPAAPMACFASIWSAPIIDLLFGNQWTATAHLLRVIALSLLFQPLLNSSGWLFLSRGRARDMMRWGFFGWGTLMLALVAGTRFGLEGIAVAYSASFALLVIPNLMFAVRGTPVTLLDALRSWAPASGAALLAALLTVPLHTPNAAWHPFLQLLVAASGYGIVYVALVATLFRQGALIVDILAHLHWPRGPQ